MQDTSDLTPECTCSSRAFDDVPSMSSSSTQSRRLCHGMPSQDRLPESTASLTSSWSCGSSHQTAAEGLRELLKP